MPDDSANQSAFAPAAQRVVARVWLRRWLAALGRTLWPVCGLVLLFAAGILLGKTAAPTILVWLAVILWLAIPLALIWRRRPRPYGALALWDQVTNRREAFATAWWFEQKEQQPGHAPLTPAQRLHVETQRPLLAAALPALNRDLPLHADRWLWLPPGLALALTLFITVLPRHDGILWVDEAMKQQALQEAAKLARTEWEKKKLDGLKTDEKADLDQLKENLKQTAQNLEKAGGKDAREVMADLERRAREAEKLAERLGADKSDWASQKLTQTLRQHADTADLGDAVAAKDADQAAKAAEALAKMLNSAQLTHDAQERMNETLKDAQKQAEKDDAKKLVGQSVLTASEKLQQSQAPAAGEQFDKLAAQMRDLAQREQTRKELEKLAQQLRDSGSNIAGQNGAGGMQQMAAAGQQGQGQQNAAGQSPKVGQAQAGQMGQNSNQQALQPPGISQMAPGQQPQQMMTPVPGTGQPPQQMMMAQGQPQPGKAGQNPGQGQPMLMAPIPGAKPGEQPSALLLGPPGSDPPSGSPPVAIAMPGGKEAGNGVAELNAAATQAQKSGNQAVVTAQQNAEGQSTVRAVEGGTRKEAAGRSASQIAVDFIHSEEEALDESALPPSRREQVRRYFTELRKRFEKQP